MTARDFKGYVGPKFVNIHKLIDQNLDVLMMVNDPSEGIVEFTSDAIIVADNFKLCNVLYIRSYKDKDKKIPFEYCTTESEKSKWIEDKEIVKKVKCLVLFG